MRITETVPANRTEGGKFGGVQGARGIAALMVVFYHATRSVSLPQYLRHIPFGNAFGFGHAGVDFFFVLSGFIITYAHIADVGHPHRVHRYLWRRATRVYPIYWFVTAFEIARSAFSPDAAARLAPSHLLNSLLLLPGAGEPVVSVAWTLRFEMLFYLLFSLTIIDRRFSRILIFAAILLVSIGTLTASADPWLALLLSPFNIEFLFGIAAANVLMNYRIPFSLIVLAAGAIFFLGTGAMELRGLVPLNGLLGRMLYGSASAAMLLGLVEAERQGRFRLGKTGVMLGDCSYGLYLIHLLVIPLTVRVCSEIGILRLLPVGILIAALVALPVALAVMLHLRVELPLMAYLRKHTPRACR